MNNTTNALTNTPFVPTEGMLEAARALFLAKAHLAVVSPIVLKYQTEILTAHQFCVRPEFTKEGMPPEVILDPSLAYLISDEDAVVFYEKCHQARDAAGLSVEQPDHCPMLVAEHKVVKCEQDLIVQLEPITNLALEKVIILQHDEYRQYVSLATRLLAPYVGSADDILTDARRLAFIVCKPGGIGVHHYQATDEEATLVDLAVTNFSHLIRSTGPWGATKYLTFEALAQLIQKHYSLDEKRIAETVSVLLRVHFRHAMQRSTDGEAAEKIRRAWVATLREGDMVEIPYSRAAEDVIQARLVRKPGDGWLKLLPLGAADACDNWITACGVNGWTNPYRIVIQPPGTASAVA